MEPVKVKSLIKCPVCGKSYILQHSPDKLQTVGRCNNSTCAVMLDICFKPGQPSQVESVSVRQEPEPQADNDKTQYVDPVAIDDKPDDPVIPDPEDYPMREPDYGGNMMLAGRSGVFGIGRQTYKLKKGSNIVGRLETDDIVVKGDDTASRSSVNLEVYYNKLRKAYSCRMHVLNAKNPVLRNGLEVQRGSAVELIADDTIVLGHTKYTFIKN